ncbi:hypothetical protein L1787_07640 [Acuticoccus sp. M5D2P5]|uniref:hypothetical protein n=1 Tax=Acuticoccus kalidii TaxID=2910977 RepID=UPI001F3EED51|nr:hypothetical protein [Acuticoccus kalidii]MCF3933282.1 hypothetical protein [Acuticoccus kalidii]
MSASGKRPHQPLTNCAPAPLTRKTDVLRTGFGRLFARPSAPALPPHQPDDRIRTAIADERADLERRGVPDRCIDELIAGRLAGELGREIGARARSPSDLEDRLLSASLRADSTARRLWKRRRAEADCRRSSRTEGGAA